MIERLYIKEYLSFEEAQLEFRKGLVVFTGPSGAGKSILINALLGLLGLKPVEAKVSEVVCDFELDLESFGIEQEELIVVRALKKEKVRYFLGAQAVSKKSLQSIFAPKISYLHQKQSGFFESGNLLGMVESFIEEKEYEETKRRYMRNYELFVQKSAELEELEAKRSNIEEQKEFLRFEIDKIESVAPKEGEYEELMALKRDLSKKEKIAEAIARAQQIFELEGAVSEALGLLERSSAFFDEAMNELRDIFYSESQRLEELESVNTEELLDRLEKLSALKRRYGSIQEALEALEAKKEELARIENIEFSLKELEEQREALLKILQEDAQRLSAMRQRGFASFERQINELLEPLKLPKARFVLERAKLGPTGWDRVEMELSGVSFKKISSGEYNRLRLCVLAAWSERKGQEGVLIVDEIDANISGEESMAVAKILKKLSRKYQIFAISHQAQLASVADQHFLVTKKEGKSFVKELEGEERTKEIARIVSGEEITKEALEYAKTILKENR